jgi:hypothetical protein
LIDASKLLPKHNAYIPARQRPHALLFLWKLYCPSGTHWIPRRRQTASHQSGFWKRRSTLDGKEPTYTELHTRSTHTELHSRSYKNEPIHRELHTEHTHETIVKKKQTRSYSYNHGPKATEVQTQSQATLHQVIHNDAKRVGTSSELMRIHSRQTQSSSEQINTYNCAWNLHWIWRYYTALTLREGMPIHTVVHVNTGRGYKRLVRHRTAQKDPDHSEKGIRKSHSKFGYN